MKIFNNGFKIIVKRIAFGGMKIISFMMKIAKSFMSQVARGASAHLFFCSVKRMRVFDSPCTGH